MVPEKLKIPDAVLDRLPSHIAAYHRGELDYEEYQRIRKAVYADLDYAEGKDGKMYPRELIQSGAIAFKLVLGRWYMHVVAEEMELPVKDKPGRTIKRMMPCRAWEDYWKREGERIDAAIKASTYADHVAQYYEDQEGEAAW